MFFYLCIYKNYSLIFVSSLASVSIILFILLISLKRKESRENISSTSDNDLLSEESLRNMFIIVYMILNAVV